MVHGISNSANVLAQQRESFDCVETSQDDFFVPLGAIILAPSLESRDASGSNAGLRDSR